MFQFILLGTIAYSTPLMYVPCDYTSIFMLTMVLQQYLWDHPHIVHDTHGALFFKPEHHHMLADLRETVDTAIHSCRGNTKAAVRGCAMLIALQALISYFPS